MAHADESVQMYRFVSTFADRVCVECIQTFWLWINWASSREYLSSGFPTKRDSNQYPQLETSLVASLDIILSTNRITKALISLRVAQAGMCLCCSQTSEDRVCRDVVQLVPGLVARKPVFVEPHLSLISYKD